MAVQGYYDAFEQGQALNETVMLDVAAAYVALGNSIRNDSGIMDRSKLLTDSGQREAGNTVYQSLTQAAKTYFGVDFADDDPRLHNLVFSLHGFGFNEISTFLQKNGPNTSLVGFLSYIENETASGFMKRRNTREASKMALTLEDAESAVQVTGTADRVDPARLYTIDSIAELLHEHAEKGAVQDSFLQGKNYAIRRTRSGLLLPDTRLVDAQGRVI